MMATAARQQPASKHVSLAEFFSGPEDKAKSELIYGEVVVSPKPSEEHQDLLHDLGEVLKRWVRFYGLGKICYDIDMVLDEAKDVAYAPDLVFVSKKHLGRRRRGRLYGPADLSVEILSLNEKPRVQRDKYRDYARYGVAWYWIVNPLGDDPILEENALVDGAYQVRTEIIGNEWFEPALFPGLQFRLPPLLEGDLKRAVRGKAKRLV